MKDGLIPEGEIEDMKAAFQARLNEEFEAGRNFKPNKADWLDGRWSGLDREREEYQPGDTAIKPETLRDVGAALTRVPEGFDIHKTVARQLEAKAKMFETGTGFDWATAEAIAFGSLATEGFPRAPCRAGLHARHLQPASFGLHRPDHRGTALPAEPHPRRTVAV